MGDLCGVCGGGHLRQGNHGNNADKVRLVRQVALKARSCLQNTCSVDTTS
jgi:hypothetical protein